MVKNSCNTCRCDRVCNHDKYGFEDCGNYIPLSSYESGNSIEIYVVKESWSIKGEDGESAHLFTCQDAAHKMMQDLIADESKNGCIHEWSDYPDFVEEVGHDFYDCWLDGIFLERHYSVRIEKYILPLSDQVIGRIGRMYDNECLIEDIQCQLEYMDEFASLSEEQQKQFLKEQGLCFAVDKAIGKNDAYFDAYWESISEVVSDKLKEFIRELKKEEENKR